jgi:hypothetical protein
LTQVWNDLGSQVAQSNAERDSEALTEDLLAGKIENIDEFLEIFMVFNFLKAQFFYQF